MQNYVGVAGSDQSGAVRVATATRIEAVRALAIAPRKRSSNAPDAVLVHGRMFSKS